MIQITPQMRVLVAVEPIDFRKGIDGVAQAVRAELEADPFSGCVFVFRNRRGSSVKLLVYDGQGFWLCQKRLSSGRFQWWPTRSTGTVQGLSAAQVQYLLYNGNPSFAPTAPVWRSVAAQAIGT